MGRWKLRGGNAVHRCARSEVRYLGWGAMSLVGVLFLGCVYGADLDNEQQHKESMECNVEKLFVEACGACHNGSGLALSGGVDLVGVGFAQALVDKQAVYDGLSGCPDPPERVIDSQNPAASLLLRKLENTQSCGSVMPPRRLPPEQIECVRTWLEQLVRAS